MKFVKSIFPKVFGLIGVVSFALSAKADVVPNSLFGDHAILQRGQPVPVWGTARDGEQVIVEFAGQKISTVAKNGRWEVRLKPLKAGGPYVMTIKGDNTVTISDILVGEVWVCSGQSNMGFRLSSGVTNGAEEIKAANYPRIRQFIAPHRATHEELLDTKSRWQLCSPETAGGFTAVGYFFARNLYQNLGIPIGIVFSAVGGTPAEWWTSPEALAAHPTLKDFTNRYANALATYPTRLAKYKTDEPTLLKKYEQELAAAKKDVTTPPKAAPRKPTPPENPALSGMAGGLYAGMIKPLQPFAIKGVIWYQGEANASRAVEYRSLFPLLIADWRKAWGQGDFPFLFVQIAPFKGIGPEIREVQLQTWQHTPYTAMVVTTDCGDVEDIHPKLKQPVGLRLSLAARAIAYGEKIEYAGPLYQQMEIKDSTVVLSFSHAKSLVSKGGNLTGFTIAGADGVFVPANATIKGKKVIVHAASVKAPTAVRYGWANAPILNLYNQDDLPASPFRTDEK